MNSGAGKKEGWQGLGIVLWCVCGEVTGLVLLPGDFSSCMAPLMCDDAVHLPSLCATEKRKILVQYNLSKVFIKALIALLVEYQSYSSSANLLQFWWVIALISFITKKCPNHSFRELSREYNKTAWLQSSHLKWPMVPQSRDRAGALANQEQGSVGWGSKSAIAPAC